MSLSRARLHVAARVLGLIWASLPALALASGPDALPPGWTVLGVEVAGTDARVHLDVDWQAYGRVDVLEIDLEAASRRLTAALADEGVRAVRLLARPLGGSAETDVVTLLEPLAPPPQRPWEQQARDSGPDAAAPSATVHGAGGLPGSKGSLSGKTVYLSPGHGWYWHSGLARWTAQRGNTHDIVEDFVNAEGALHYLEPLLRNAGAQVIGVRELDHNPKQLIVDDGDAAGGSKLYSESGPWQKGSDAGFGNGQAPYQGAANPFALGGYRVAAAVKGTSTAIATFRAAVPASGMYAVKLGWTAGSNRAKDVHVEVRHAGGVTHLRVDQSRHGQSWWPIGTFAFQAGADVEQASVRIHNDTLGDPAGKYVVADVVRFGGGMGEIVRGNGKPPASGPTSERPRWEECGRYYTQYSGAPPSVWDSSSADNNDDVTSRSRFSGWHHEPPDDAIYLSWHSNAPDPGRGTSTYVYGPNPPDGSKTFTATKGSVELGGWLQKTIVADIKAELDPAWKDRGLYSAYFGEVNPTHNPDMPAALVECAFHSTKADADYLREPRFRHLLARAMVKAIIRYFAERDGLQPIVPPEAPRGVHMVAATGGNATLSWDAPPTGGANGDAATGYLVETSLDGLGFAPAGSPTSTSFSVSLPSDGKPLFARVRATNPGGVSLPTAIVGAAAGCAGAPRALVVQGFSRLQASQLPVENMAPWDLANVQRLRQWMVNDYSYLLQHITDLAALGFTIDSVERAAFGDVDLGSIALLDWAAGEQSSTDGVLDAAERKQVAAWLGPASDSSGPARAMWLSGSEVGWALGPKGDASSADWLATWFGAAYADDDAETYALDGGSMLATVGAFGIADGSVQPGVGSAYDVDWPDSFTTVGNGKAIASYTGGKGGIAATSLQQGKASTVLMGVPLEMVTPPFKRAALVADLAAISGLALPAKGCSAGTGGGDADAGGDVSADAGDTGSDWPPDDGWDGDLPPADTTGAADAPTTDAAANDGATGSDVGGTDDAAGDNDTAAPPGDGLAAADGDIGGSIAPPAKVAKDDGCGCSVRGGNRDPGRISGPLALLLLIAVVLGARRRREAHVAPAQGRSR